METTERMDKINQFLDESDWGRARKIAINSDASGRKYFRLFDDAQRRFAILMDAGDEPPKAFDSFIKITKFLRHHNLSAPEIFAKRTEDRLLILEDLGDGLFSRLFASKRVNEQELYQEAVNVIHGIHAASGPEELPDFGPNEMAQALDLTFLYYANPGTEALSEGGQEVMGAFENILNGLGSYDAVSLRDYHSENLIWLPDREGTARVGLLDYQDAVFSHPTYDLVSLTRDARRRVSPELTAMLTREFASFQGVSPAEISAQASVIAVQRNLRILGVFARLALTKKKAQYIAFIPRIWGYLQDDLRHPSLSQMAQKLQKILPEPDQNHLERLKQDGQ